MTIQVTEPIALSAEQQEIALAETQAILAASRAGDYRDRLAGLAASLQEGELVDADEVAELDSLLSLALQTGRLRALYGPGGEQAALRLHRRLPTGAELAASAEAVGEALASLRGRELEAATLRAVGPGAFALTLRAGGAELSIRLDRQGARLTSVGV
jgi:hypothetical protein